MYIFISSYYIFVEPFRLKQIKKKGKKKLAKFTRFHVKYPHCTVNVNGTHLINRKELIKVIDIIIIQIQLDQLASYEVLDQRVGLFPCGRLQ